MWTHGPGDRKLRSTLISHPGLHAYTLRKWNGVTQCSFPTMVMGYLGSGVMEENGYFGSSVQRFWSLVSWLYYSGFEMKKDLETAGHVV